MRTTIEYGIDLGTSNSAIARQDGATTRFLLDSEGRILLPSAVSVRADGSILVGHEATDRRAIDPDDTALEFKRQIGRGDRIAFPSSGRSFTAEELSAEVLKALLARAERDGSGPLKAAVITIPAMFQLAQCDATRRAANLAGIELAPLLQEPIAAAIAHCGTGEPQEGQWLVYDLGGGTFDVSLVRSKGGRLQVMDHDGDNHLGGKDFNRVLARWAAEQVRAEGRLGEFRRNDPTFASAFARLSDEAERVRLRLSSDDQTAFRVEELAKSPSGEPVGIELNVDRGQLESLIAPIVRRTTDACQAVLARNRLTASDLRGIILVGGPTRTPCLTSLIRDAMGIEPRHSLDPMTIVAAGAALFASTQRLPRTIRPTKPGSETGADAALSLQLEFESMTTNPSPRLVGRVESGEAAGVAVKVRRDDGEFEGSATIDAKGSFSIPLKLRPRTLNLFHVTADRPVEPSTFTILHGMSLAKPPLSQSVGVLLADGTVRWYLRKGVVLPARQTHTQATTRPLLRGQSGEAIRVPLVQGESERGDRNALIGFLGIHADTLPRDLPAGSEVEVTLAVDEFSRTTAKAYVPLLDTWYDEIVQLEVEAKSIDDVGKGLSEQKDRLKALEEQADALESAGQPTGKIDQRLREVEDLIGEGDRDSVELADQLVRVMTQHLDRAEGVTRRSKLEAEFEAELKQGLSVAQNDQQKQELNALDAEFHVCLERGDIDLAEAKLLILEERVRQVMYQSVEYWKWLFSHLYHQLEGLKLLGVARSQIQDGMEAYNAGSIPGLYHACVAMIELLPQQERSQIQVPMGQVGSGVM